MMTKARNSPFSKDLRRILPGVLISAILLAVVFSAADLTELKDELVNADYRYLPLSILVFLASIFVRAAAWRTLLEGKAPYRRVFFTLNEGYFLNNILPFRPGEVGRAFLLIRAYPLSFWQVVSTIMIERALDVLIVVAILLSTLPFVVGVEGATSRAFAVGGVVLLALIVLHLLARNRQRVLDAFAGFQDRFPVLHRLNVSQIDTFFQGLSALTDLRRFLLSFGLMVVAWALLVMHYWLMLLAFVHDATVFYAAFGISMVGLSVAVPSAPGALGVVEATLVFVFGLFGVSRSKALAYSLVVHAIYLVITSLLGFYGLLVDGESFVEIYRRIRVQARKLKPVS
ncbi:MAG: lysylphosphatidylglycerol synthase transmembrane domain-containing protein [Anaerolineales bacterium]